MTAANLSAFDLTGEVALCTGATSGIGRRMAWALAQAGADVILLGRRQEQLESAKAEIEAANAGRAVILAADLAQHADFTDLVKEAGAAFGAPTALVNAAGINLREAPDDITPESWDLTLKLNLTVPFFLARACVPAMRAAQHGSIINIASLQSFRAFPNCSAYGASKGGIAQLTRAMAEAWSADGITANAIAPGFFPTELTEAVFADPERAAHNAGQTAMGRNGKLEDLDGITVFLASQAARYITGQVINVDGGFTAK
ncbi:SDR family NAD(P)-dependent oxidoreductase [Denitrobaculum tricleocarpae]|uniref:SDR family oxidoreductase n=1 Tax=Denitrobaculum tricleocarpae TaxID=2591009 RepID=A0A545U315_9PROT|nr:SDR family oxidoreductase [Denitrobaculum tricleocarpae]TQV83877.1 SDR family oxidoreductase [Denitrobaculum tricleocarpae]